MWVKRTLNLGYLLSKNSYFLLGPRSVGKTQLIRQELDFDEVQFINLLDSQVYLRLQSNPSLLKNMVSKKVVIIDEIQRIPELLNIVHLLIEEKNIKFLLTGSSARKLRKQGVNLLGGRAFKSALFPLTSFELGSLFDLDTYLNRGGLPLSYLSENFEDFLYNYVDIYLKEEIQAEALVRNLPNYQRFLNSAAFYNAQMINFTKVASDAGLSPNTVKDYYGILEDSLIGFQIQAWTKSIKRKAISRSKFYFFDPGVARVLNQIKFLEPKSDFYGRAFEHFIICELRAFLSYHEIRENIYYWQSKSQFEVDIVVGDVAIEVKASEKTTSRDHKGLKALSEEKEWRRKIIVSKDFNESQFENGIEHLYWKNFLSQLWDKKIFKI